MTHLDMKRYLPLALTLSMMGAVYACSSDKTEEPATPGDDAGNNNNNNTGPDSSTPATDSGGGEDAGNGDSSVPTGNPIEGVGAPQLVTHPTNFTGYADGPQFKDGAIYFGDYYDSKIWKCTAPNTCVVARDLTAGYQPNGTTFDDKAKTFITAELDPTGTLPAVLNRWLADGGLGTPITPTFDGGVGFDGPNDVVVRSDGTVFVTDPAYPSGNLTNRVWRISPTGAGIAVVEVTQGEHPNGIALSKDEKTLFVSFTDNPTGKPNIKKYAVNADGTLGAGAIFAEVDTGSDLDGIAVDEAGNLYAAVKTGVEVFKPDGQKWGKVTTDKQATNVGFGGNDLKTLYITANGGVYQVTGLKVAGIAR